MEAILPASLFPAVKHGKLAAVLDSILIYGSIILVPYDLPFLHQACLPLMTVAIALMAVRGDMMPFLAFVWRLRVSSILAMLVCVLAVFSLYGNINVILGSQFQGESGWSRGLLQAVLLLATSVYPFYLAFCLSRHGDWQRLIIRAAWWSLPIPLVVGVFQLANYMGVHGLAHLPYVGGAYEGGFFRLTSVARESSWFGSFTCVLLPFLAISLSGMRMGWRKLTCFAAVVVLLVFFFFGFSKSAYAALAMELAAASLVALFIRRRWIILGKVVFSVLTICTMLLCVFALAPEWSFKRSAPLVNGATTIYNIFEPLILGDTKFVSIGTRLGMSAAGVSMGQDHPVVGVGLGQFGFHVYNYIPLWGVNSETIDWLSNDVHAWPSTSNLYTRLLAEIGGLGVACYLAFRVLAFLGVGLRLMRADSPTWWRDRAVFCVLIALIAYDFHRDSFVNQDLLLTLGMALACMSETARDSAVRTITSGRIRFLFAGVATIGLATAMVVILMQPVAYQARAILVPKPTGITIADAGLGSGLSVVEGGKTYIPFRLFRTFWGSRSVAARMISARPDIVRRVLGPNNALLASELSRYISDNVTVLLEDKETTVTLEYRNPNPELAEQFLALAISQTDGAVAAVSQTQLRESGQLGRIFAMHSPDVVVRETLLRRTAAQELQSRFDLAGETSSFDYVERPETLRSVPSPDPATAILFAILLAVLTGGVAVMVFLIAPVREKVRQVKIVPPALPA